MVKRPVWYLIAVGVALANVVVLSALRSSSRAPWWETTRDEIDSLPETGRPREAGPGVDSPCPSDDE